MKSVMIFIIKLYQKGISPALGANKCIFHPTCSQYAIEAYEHYGFFRGTLKAIWRVLRCNPFNKKGGYDPVDKI